ncbi:hypothetical protein [Culicoidibacter larvae]|uniref:Uncharacterized protein n=1 Tax=Culicoidibacter larvae TaxID=2579976 RepID=A0A5R8Q7H7_9FIRM|nr:hypothetical protein [Culicoidibacter larvae]TLG71081.1 hypothetical protein FEZ08_11765 [Culicoidibacter larvae]
MALKLPFRKKEETFLDELKPPKRWRNWLWRGAAAFVLLSSIMVWSVRSMIPQVIRSIPQSETAFVTSYIQHKFSNDPNSVAWSSSYEISTIPKLKYEDDVIVRAGNVKILEVKSIDGVDRFSLGFTFQITNLNGELLYTESSYGTLGVSERYTNTYLVVEPFTYASYDFLKSPEDDKTAALDQFTYALDGEKVTDAQKQQAMAQIELFYERYNIDFKQAQLLVVDTISDKGSGTFSDPKISSIALIDGMIEVDINVTYTLPKDLGSLDYRHLFVIDPSSQKIQTIYYLN